MDENEIVERMKNIADIAALFLLLEECDSKECVYTWQALVDKTCEYYIEDFDGKG